MARAWKLLLVASLATIVNSPVAVSASNNASFPGAPSKLVSPNGEFTIVNKDTQRDGEPCHLLYLHRAKNASKKKAADQKIYEYGRSVEVVWAPDSKHFVVNDMMGSNIAVPLLFSVNNLQNPIDLSEQLTDFVKDKQDKKSLTKNDHLYFRCIKWKKPGRIEIAVAGHGDSDQSGFTLVYEHDLGGGFKKIKRVPQEKLLAIQ